MQPSKKILSTTLSMLLHKRDPLCISSTSCFIYNHHYYVGRRFYSRSLSLEFFIDIILPAAPWPWGLSASNINEYQEYFLWGKGGRCVGLTTLSHSCAKCLEIWEPQPPGTLRACQGL